MSEKQVRVSIKSIITDLVALAQTERKMGEEYMLDHISDAEQVIEYSTDGTLSETEDTVILRYEEASETGIDNTFTTLVFPKDQPNFLNMGRSGEYKASIVFNDKVRRQPCVYNVCGHTMEFCITTRHIDNKLTLEGGSIDVDYIIEMNGMNAQRTRFSANVVPRIR